MLVRLGYFGPDTFRSDEGLYGVKIESHWIILVYLGLRALVIGAALAWGTFLLPEGWPVLVGWIVTFIATAWCILKFYDRVHTYLIVTPKRVYTFVMDDGIYDPVDYVSVGASEARKIDWSYGTIIGSTLRMADITFNVAGDAADITFKNAYYPNRVKRALSLLSP